MTYTQTATRILRIYQYVTSDFDLLNCLTRDFSDADGNGRLAQVLGVSPAMAVAILAGEVEPNMARLAFHYNYVPADDGIGWQRMSMTEQPFDPGPPRRWTRELMQYLREVFSNPTHRPPIQTLVWGLDTTERRLRDALRRHRISVA